MTSFSCRARDLSLDRPVRRKSSGRGRGPASRNFPSYRLAAGLLALSWLSTFGFSQSAGYALELDGTNDFVKIDSTATVMQGNNWESEKTLSVWIKPANVSGPDARPERGALIVGNDRPRSFGISRAVWDGSDRIWAFNADADGVDFVGIDVNTTQWAQITMVHSGGLLQILRNGITAASVASGPTVTLNGSAVGTIYIGGSESSRTVPFAGQLDELRLWNTGVDPQTVLDWVNRPVDGAHPQWSQLVAYYQMIEGAGTTLSDQSQFSNVGSLLGGMGDQSWVGSGAFGGGGNSIPVADPQAVATEEDTPVGIQLTGSDLDEDPLSYRVVSGPGSGELAGQAPDLVYTPAPDFQETDSFWFKVNDGLVDSAQAQVTITVAPVNDPPVAADDVSATSETTAVLIDVLANDSDVDGDVLSILSVTSPAGGFVENLGDSVRYTPAAGFTGDDGFSYTISDGHGGVAVADVAVTVTGMNAPPTAADQALTTAEDTSIAITLGGTDSDGDPLSFEVTGGPTSGALSGDAPDLVYTPAQNFHGADSFSFLVNDGLADSEPAQITIDVTPVNDDPVALDDTATTSESTAVTIEVLDNDGDVDGDLLTLIMVTDASGGMVENLGTGIRYTPADGTLGQDGFDYTVSDSNGGTASAHVTVTVNPALGLAGYALEFDGQSDYVGLGETAAMLGTGWEDQLTVSLWVLPLGPAEDCQGAALCNAIFGDRPRWWGISRGVVAGQDRLWIWNYDGNADVIPIDYTEGQWVHLAMVHADGLFKAFKDGVEVGSIPSGTTLQPNTGANPVLQIGGVISSDNFTFRGQIDEVSIWSRGRTSEEIADDFHGILNGGESGLVAYYRMSDGSGTTLSDDTGNGWNGILYDGGPNVPPDGQIAQWVDSTAPITHVPSADDQSIVTQEDNPVDITLSGSDPDGVIVSYELVSGPTAGQLTGVAPNLVYTPSPDFNGTDSFDFKVNDGVASSPTATASIDVTPVNDPPVAVDDAAATSEGTAVLIAVLTNDTDVDGDILAVTGIGTATGGLVENLGSTIRYTPAPGFSGVDSFGYTVGDGHGGTDASMVVVTVAGVNTPPMAEDQNLVTAEDSPVGLTLGGSDPDGDSLTYVLVSSPVSGQLSGSPPNLVYTPSSDFNGIDSFRFKVNDGLADSPEASVTFTVTAVNDPPVAADDSGVTPIETPLTIAVLSNDSDVDGDVLTVSAVDAATNGTVENLGNAVRYTPVIGFVGTDVFGYTISDGHGGMSNATIQVTVANELILQETGSLSTPGDAWNVTVRDGLAYVADVGAGLRIVDVSDPANPVEIGDYNTSGRTYDVEVVDNLAYVTDGRDGIKIIDISDPTAPWKVGEIRTADFAWGLTVELPYVYVGDRLGGIRILDVSDPSQPVEVSSLPTPGQALDVLVRGDLAYLADFDGRLRVIDISDRANPFEVAAVSLAGIPFGLREEDGLLYVAAGQGGLWIFDLSNPSIPVEVSSLAISGLARNVALMGSFAFVTADTEGLQVVDVFDPLQPIWTATIDTPGRVRGVAADSGYVYIADHEGGLRIVRIF